QIVAAARPVHIENASICREVLHAPPAALVAANGVLEQPRMTHPLDDSIAVKRRIERVDLAVELAGNRVKLGRLVHRPADEEHGLFHPASSTKSSACFGIRRSTKNNK